MWLVVGGCLVKGGEVEGYLVVKWLWVGSLCICVRMVYCMSVCIYVYMYIVLVLLCVVPLFLVM